MIKRLVCLAYGHGDTTHVATKHHGRRKVLVFFCHRCKRSFERDVWTD